MAEEFIPYSRQEIGEKDIAAVEELLRSNFLTQGPAGPAFEKAFAERHGVAHAVAVSNATAALHLGCRALGVGPGSRVWTSPNSFVASANCALYLGASVDFVDIDPVSRNMSIPALAAKLEAADRSGTLPTVVIPVDFSGLPCDLADLRSLADRYNFKILEDASHATGASYKGAPIGAAYADATVFSFHAVKIVTTAEGGMITTPNEALAEKLRLLRSHGVTRDENLMAHPSEGGWYYEQVALGWNYRLTDIQSALGLSQLQRVDTWRDLRARHADRYDRLLDSGPFKLPIREADKVSAWHLYAVELTAEANIGRAELFAAMREANIGVNVHYMPIHCQPYYADLGFARQDFPNAVRYYEQALSIPLFPAMTEAEQDRVVETMMALAI
ncbi:UDP-4-amino-4,6-dideoxy-N-acetyl-beta-L-altrosamine transaminase [Altererythrobacter sp. SALINAS58]|uniref:UDP-4-amino-4, 6-dideoxy-N-acetyl-beta-L-altrosamine transaminase n=1 Tax=Alteripontixanthobacter muriae TaxID=2705546 RepID=UPI00157664C4|nr:UDP-4-amino-4,6-dideoxy-N-acetyl-beta-L-altrosamine transaminase [Alteripontixanthobacter muriae]NTZ43426.1 UDP-4-amino-4,6-dideoxy-N-acetyl-beta-L-altrosamine transaminase [Alteripontixanthobacter muriae]